MQVDPINPTLKAPGTKRLKLKCHKLLSRFAFKFNLRRFKKGRAARLSGDHKRATTELSSLRQAGSTYTRFIPYHNTLNLASYQPETVKPRQGGARHRIARHARARDSPHYRPWLLSQLRVGTY
jgi:hypothetical protein